MKAIAATSRPTFSDHAIMVVEMFREDPEFAAEYLNQVLEDGSRSELLLAMRYLTVAFSGLAGIAQATRSNASALYRTFSKRGNPKLVAVAALLEAMGLHLVVTPIKQPR